MTANTTVDLPAAMADRDVETAITIILEKHGLHRASVTSAMALRACFGGSASPTPYEMEAGATELEWIVASLAPLTRSTVINTRRLVCSQGIRIMSWLYRNTVRVPPASAVSDLLLDVLRLSKNNASRQNKDQYADIYTLLFGRRIAGEPNADLVVMQARRLADFLNRNLEPHPGKGSRAARAAMRLYDDAPVVDPRRAQRWEHMLGPVPENTVRFDLDAMRIAALREQAPDPWSPAVLTGLGDHVRQLRRRGRLTLKALAWRSGLAVSTLQHIEEGKVDPQLSTLMRLAAGLGITIEHLLMHVEAYE